MGGAYEYDVPFGDTIKNGSYFRDAFKDADYPIGTVTITTTSSPAIRLYPFLGDREWYVEWAGESFPRVYPSWWRRILQRVLLGWRWEKA